MKQQQLGLAALAAVSLFFSTQCNNYALLDKLEDPCVSCSIAQAQNSIYLFTASSITSGDLRILGTAREGADSRCSSSRGGYTFPNNACTNVRGFISVSGVDSIAAMPTAYGIDTGRMVHGPTGVLIANNWADLLDGSIANTLNAAGVVAGNWWSFSTANGATGNDCADGVSSGAGVTGILGSDSSTGAAWMLSNSSETCDQQHKILCVCY